MGFFFNHFRGFRLLACCNFIFIEEEMAWRNDAPVGASRGRAFSSGRLQATTLRHISTYASVYKSSLYELNASRIKWHQTNQRHSRNRPESPAQLSAMRRRCGRLKTTKLLSVRSEGENVKDTSVECNDMQDHSLPYLGPLYSSLLHFWKKEGSTLDVS